jgi:phytoene dehydrogenase-like protein
VAVSDGAATGVVIAGETIPADAVIVTQDALNAIDSLFDEPIHEPWADRMRCETTPVLDVFIGFGVEADLKDLPESITFPLNEPIRFGDLTYGCIGINNYAGFAGYAPGGCTALTTVLIGDSYDFWKKCKEDGMYAAEKQTLAEAVIRAIEQKYPQVAGKITVWDVATPLTYERYLHSYKGSWMSVMKKGQGMKQYPVKPESIKNLYFAGQRMISPGGTPVALSTGREAVQHLCRDTDTMFQANY